MSVETRLQVLVVDDDAPVRASLRRALEEAGHAVAEAGDGEEALAWLGAQPADVVLLDINLPGLGGLDALPRIRETAPDTSVIMVTGEATLANAMRAGQRGAYDFIEKPVALGHLTGVVAEAGRLTRMRRGLPAAGAAGAPFGMVGRSPALQALVEQVRRVAPSQGRVLITGENGAGKELVAHAIHALSKRAAGPFVKLNCAAIPRDLVESELFGYKRGAFTGAMQSKKGRLELADGGTLFLDEIGGMPPAVQVKLLRVLQDRSFERVGGSETLRVDVRLIAATNRDLAAEVAAGRFREDLFHRLSVVRVALPPLRERPEDIPLLVEGFIREFDREHGRRVTGITRGVLDRLTRYPWPGNVRQLRNTVEGMVVFAEGRRALDLSDLPDALREVESAGEKLELRVGMTVAEAERQLIAATLRHCGDDKPRAAAMLGIGLRTLYRKLEPR